MSGFHKNDVVSDMHHKGKKLNTTYCNTVIIMSDRKV